jgi:hypothetical protein
VAAARRFLRRGSQTKNRLTSTLQFSEPEATTQTEGELFRPKEEAMDERQIEELAGWLLRSNPKGMKEEEIERIFAWAEKALLDAAMVELLLQRKVTVSWDAKAGEPRFFAAHN